MNHYSTSYYITYSSVAQQANSGLGDLTVDVATSHTITHTPGRTPSDQLAAEAVTYATQNTTDEHP